MCGRVAAWVLGSLGYWLLVLSFATGALLSACEPPLAGCSSFTAGHVLLIGAGVYLAAIGLALFLRRARRSE